MKDKILDVIRKNTVAICFLVFVGLNTMFSLLYCGSVSGKSWIFTICWSFILCGIITFLPIIAKRVVIVLLTIFYSLSCVVHAVMYKLFGSFFSFSDMLYTEDGMAFFSFSYINVRKLLWIVVIGCVATSIFLAWNLKKQKYKKRQLLVGAVLIIVGIGGIFTLHKNIMSDVNTTLAWNEAAQQDTEADIYQTMTNKNHAMSMMGIYQYLYRNFMITSGLENRLNNGEMYTELDAYFSEQSKTLHETNKMTGIFEGKDVFFIMLESIDTWMLDEEYMPNLYGLQQDSLNFVNHHSPLYISAGTFNTEFIANTSIIPPTSGVDTKVYKENEYPYSLANCFKKAGYSVNSFHSSNPTIYNRGEIHENLGYEKYHNWSDMGMENHELDSQMVNGYSKMVSDDAFFSFIITYSGHGPYTEELHNISDPHMDKAKELVSKKQIVASEEDLEEYTYAIAHAMETDQFVGSLVEKLEKDGRMDDTVLIFFSDHFGKYMTNHEFVMELKNTDNKDFLCNTPFFIYNKETPSQTIKTISSTVDIAPTIANLFALDTKYEYYTGVDIFSDCEHYVVFQGNSWYDGETYYSTEYKGEMTEKVIATNQNIVQKMRCSEYILKCDYFSYLESK